MIIDRKYHQVNVNTFKRDLRNSTIRQGSPRESIWGENYSAILNELRALLYPFDFKETPYASSVVFLRESRTVGKIFEVSVRVEGKEIVATISGLKSNGVASLIKKDDSVLQYLKKVFAKVETNG